MEDVSVMKNITKAKVCIFMRGAHFFKYAALSPHKLPISVQNMQGLHGFITPAFSLQKSHICLSRKLKNVELV